jgi:hypothetical protein
MTHYTVSNSKGSFEREDMTGEKKEETPPTTADSPQDTIQQEPILRPQTRKHAKGQ